jgi:hypothetical protein
MQFGAQRWLSSEGAILSPESGTTDHLQGLFHIHPTILHMHESEDEHGNPHPPEKA